MNRTIFFSIVGLGVFSAVGLAGSRSQQTGVVTCGSSSSSAPVVLVTQPDGNCVVAQCVSVTTCDPKAKGQGGAKAYTFTTQGGLVSSAGSATAVAGCNPVGESGSGGGSCASEKLAIVRQELAAKPAVHSVTVEGDATTVASRWNRLRGSRASEPVAAAEAEAMAGVMGAEGEGGEPAHRQLEHKLVAAQKHLDAHQDEMRHSLQRATEEASAAQERARAVYAEAMESYQDAMQDAQKRSREVHERALVERKAQGERGEQRSKRTSPRAVEKSRGDHDATLEARIEALEDAARGRGQSVESKRSLEERVAQLEKLSALGVLAPRSGQLRLKRDSELGETTPLPRTYRLQKPNGVAPMAPVPPTPPSARPAPLPYAEAIPFMKMRRAQPGVPAAPAPGAMRDEERQDMARAMDDLKREAKRLREELARMRAEVERLPHADETR